MSGSKEYEVERIVAKRERDGGTFYLVKWKGYSEDAKSWELRENLQCQELINEFEKRNSKRQGDKKEPDGGKGMKAEAESTPKTGEEGKKKEDAADRLMKELAYEEELAALAGETVPLAAMKYFFPDPE